MKVINLFGGPGSGKSTTAAGLFNLMKKKGLEVELVTEYAKDLIYSGRMPAMNEYQEVLFAEQNFRLQRLISHVNYVVTDSPIILSNVYAELNRQNEDHPQWPALIEFKSLVWKQFMSYDNINIFLERPDIYQEYGRTQTQEEAEELDQMIKDELDRSGCQFESVKVHEFVEEELMTWLGFNK